jgi:predicted nucleotidyltransferase
MHASIASKRAEIADLCERLGVARLDLFGSATTEAFDEAHSDADFYVEFRGGEGFDHFHAYIDLKDGLEALLGRPVDLVMSRSLENPYFRERMEQTREPVYAT